MNLPALTPARRWSVWALTLCVACPVGPAVVRAGESLAGRVPADVGLFVEAQHADDLLTALSETDAWLALAELAGQPARAQDADEWRRRIRQTIGMDPAEAIRVLFSQQVAFAGEGLGRTQDALVLCRPTEEVRIRELLKTWNAQPQPFAGRADVYQLRNRVGLAIVDGLLIFGDRTPPAGLFARTLRFVTVNPPARLADDPAYRALLARVPADPDATLFARLRIANRPATQPSSQAASEPAAIRAVLAALPGPLRESDNLLLSLHRDGNLLHFTGAGDAVPTASPPERSSAVYEMIAGLPERTLLAWGAHVDYAAAALAVQELSDQHVLKVAYKIQSRGGGIERLLASVQSATCIAVGTVAPLTRPQPAPPVPAVALLLATDTPTIALGEFDSLARAGASVYNLLAVARGHKLLPEVVDTTFGDLALRQLDLSPLLEGLDGGAVAELRLSWMLDEGVLIVATHEDWLRQIVAARRGGAPTLARVLRLSRERVPPTSGTMSIVQIGPISDLGTLWLRHLEAHHPDVLEQGYWRRWQPPGAVRLGITVREQPERKRLRLDALTPDSPAAGILQPGDLILGCNRTAFATTQPVQEMRQAVLGRPDARWLDVAIERDGTALTRRVPLPFVDPIQVLRKAIAIGRIAQRVVYYDEPPAEHGSRGFLTAELRTSSKPLFEFPLAPLVQPTGPSPGE